jgi:hypothetical protein
MEDSVTGLEFYVAMTCAFITATVLMEIFYAGIHLLTGSDDE